MGNAQLIFLTLLTTIIGGCTFWKVDSINKMLEIIKEEKEKKENNNKEE